MIRVMVVVGLLVALLVTMTYVLVVNEEREEVTVAEPQLDVDEVNAELDAELEEEELLVRDPLVTRMQVSVRPSSQWKQSVGYKWRKENVTPRFSVIVMGSDHWRETMESVLLCTLEPFEVIVVGKQSFDGFERGECCGVFTVADKESGIRFASSINIILIKSGTVIMEEGYNLALERPLLVFNDVSGVIGRSRSAIGRSGKSRKWNEKLCYRTSVLMPSFETSLEDWDLILLDGRKLGGRYVWIPIEMKPVIKEEIKEEKLPMSITYYRHRKKIEVLKNVCLVTFANENSIHMYNAQLAQLMHVKLGMDFEYRMYTERDVVDWLRELPQDVHENPKRGYYYWAWKPWIILDTMRLMPLNSIILYLDAGMYLNDKQLVLETIEQAYQSGYVVYDLTHTNRLFCKPECYYLLNESDLAKPMTDASILFLKNTIENQHVVEKWMELCKMDYMISDKSNPDFNLPSNFDAQNYIEHRHDQLLLSTVVRNAKWKTEEAGSKLRFMNHHRTRDWQGFMKLWKACGL